MQGDEQYNYPGPVVVAALDRQHDALDVDVAEGRVWWMGGFRQVEPALVGWHVEPKPVGFPANVTRSEEVGPMQTLSILGAPSSSRSRD